MFSKLLGVNTVLAMKKFFDWILSHRYWTAISVFVAAIGVSFAAATYFLTQEMKIEQVPERDAASPIMSCEEKKSRCKEISDLIKRKESEVEEESYRDAQISGPIRVAPNQQSKISRPLSSDEMARKDELKQLRDQIHELNNDLFQCEKAACSDHTK